jgi:hypothetical protein
VYVAAVDVERKEVAIDLKTEFGGKTEQYKCTATRNLKKWLVHCCGTIHVRSTEEAVPTTSSRSSLDMSAVL